MAAVVVVVDDRTNLSSAISTESDDAVAMTTAELATHTG